METVDEITKSLSDGLSLRQKKFIEDGNRLNDNSKKSEKILISAIDDIILPYCKKKFKDMFDSEIKLLKTISLYELQKIFHKNGGPEPNEDNKNVYMKPDGGIFVAIINGEEYPILIIEDKIQGTNDIRFKNGESKQALGNAIERGAKNIRGAEMLFSKPLNIFPYVLFASGCDFHSSETISKRIEMMNYGIPNHTIELSKTNKKNIKEEITKNILPNINISKRYGKDIVSIFVKTHKWNELENGASKWEKNEIGLICCNIIDKVCVRIVEYLNK